MNIPITEPWENGNICRALHDCDDFEAMSKFEFERMESLNMDLQKYILELFFEASTDPDEQAKAVYLMLLLTHPEIEGDATQPGELLEEGYQFRVTLEGEDILIWIIISGEWMSEKEEPARMKDTFRISEDGTLTKMMEVVVYRWAFKSVFHLYHAIGHEGQHSVDLVTKGYTDEESAFGWNRSHDYIFPYYMLFPYDRKKYGNLPHKPR